MSFVTNTRLRASTVCVHDGKLLTVRLRDVVSGVERLFPPGGAVDAGETPAEAAVRETREETGYEVRLTGAERVFHYPFQWAGKWYDCTTHFFRAELVDPAAEPAEAERDDMHQGVVWVPLPDVRESLAYDAYIRQAVLELSR